MFKLSKPYVGRYAYGKTVDSTYLRSVNVELQTNAIRQLEHSQVRWGVVPRRFANGIK